MPLPSTLSIGAVSERTGLSVSAIRYYEEERLVAPERNAGGQRRFLRSDLRRLSFVMISQQLGFSIRQIREILCDLPADKAPSKQDWEAISKTFHKDLDQRIALMTRLRDLLDGCIGCGCLSLEKCKLYNPNDEKAALGKGPRTHISD